MTFNTFWQRHFQVSHSSVLSHTPSALFLFEVVKFIDLDRRHQSLSFQFKQFKRESTESSDSSHWTMKQLWWFRCAWDHSIHHLSCIPADPGLSWSSYGELSRPHRCQAAYRSVLNQFVQEIPIEGNRFSERSKERLAQHATMARFVGKAVRVSAWRQLFPLLVLKTSPWRCLLLLIRVHFCLLQGQKVSLERRLDTALPGVPFRSASVLFVLF